MTFNPTLMFLVVAVYSCVGAPADEVPFPRAGPDRLIEFQPNRATTLISIPAVIGDMMRAQIDKRDFRGTCYATALHLIMTTDQKSQVLLAPRKERDGFVFNDHQNGSWQIAYEILKVLADYSLENNGIDDAEKSRYLMAYTCHTYGRLMAVKMNNADVANSSQLKILERYYKDRSVANSDDVEIYAWYVYFNSCVLRYSIPESDIAKVNTIISDVNAMGRIPPRAYQMLCMARMQGDRSLDYLARKRIFREKLFESLVRFGGYQTREGEYLPYTPREYIDAMLDSDRRGYGIEGSVEKLRKKYGTPDQNPDSK